MIKLLWDFSGELVYYVTRLKESLELALLLSMDGSDHFSTRVVTCSSTHGSDKICNPM